MTTYGATPAGFFLKPVTQILSEINASCLTNVDPLLDTSPTSPQGQLNGIMAEKIGECWEVLQTLSNVVNRDAADDFLLDNIGSLTGSPRHTVKPSYVYCNVTLQAAHSPYLAGTLVANVSGQPTIQFHNAYDISITADGTYSQLFISVADGPIVALSGTLNAISTPVTGWSAVTNPLDATLGTLVELDTDYRLRQENELAAAGACTADSIRADLIAFVPGVVSAQVLQNVGDVMDANSLPPHSLWAIVYDGVTPQAQNAAIGQMLWNDKPSGTYTFGATSVQVVDSQGNTQVVNFSRPQQLLLYLNLTVTFVPNLSTSAQNAAITAIKTALSTLNSTPTDENNGYQILPGTKVKARTLAAIAEDISGIDEVTALTLDFIPSPTNTATLLVSPNQIAVVDSSRILVNGV